MDFQIVLTGMNHRATGVDIRERFALTDFCTPESWAMPCADGIRESLILSTCNRVEVLGVGHADAHQKIIELWANTCQRPVTELQSRVYTHFDLDAARHVFEVASSLDSMVLGEPQILGQLKEAYRKSVNAGAAGPILNGLMHKAFSVAKRVRNETAVAASAVSISYAAVELAKRIFGSMHGHKAMLVGAGEMAELAALHLLQAGASEIIVLNRTYTRAQELAERIHGKAVPFENLKAMLNEVDMVIASTGSREPIIWADDIKKALKTRKNRPMFLIDIAVPRDIEPAANTLDNVYLYDIDDLKEVVEENISARKEEAAKARLIIDEEIEVFSRWLKNLEVQPTILELVRRGEQAASAELAKTLKKFANISPDEKHALEMLAFSIVHKLNHDPVMFLKSGGTDSTELVSRIDTIRKVFNLDKNA